MTRIKAGLSIEAGGREALNRRLDSIWGLRREVGDAIHRAVDVLHRTSTLTARLRELVRLRIAFHNQCRTCMAVRYETDSVSEELVCSLEKPGEAPDLTEQERVALHFADLFATNHLAIDDAEYDRLRQWFNEGELVELGALCGLCVGMGRLHATWHIVEDLPAGFQHDERVAPWRQDEVVPKMRKKVSAEDVLLSG